MDLIDVATGELLAVVSSVGLDARQDGLALDGRRRRQVAEPGYRANSDLLGPGFRWRRRPRRPHPRRSRGCCPARPSCPSRCGAVESGTPSDYLRGPVWTQVQYPAPPPLPAGGRSGRRPTPNRAMKRRHELILKILEWLESRSSPWEEHPSELADPVTGEPVAKDVLQYHVDLCGQAGLIRVKSGGSAPQLQLTWAGHEELNARRTW